jgi:hypothetical protein
MRSGTLILAASATLAAGIAGFFCGRAWLVPVCSCPACPEIPPEPVAELPSPQPGVPAPARAAGTAECDPVVWKRTNQELVRLEARAAQLEKSLEEQKQETYGTPIHWEQAPSQYQPEAFRGMVREAMEEIGDTAELVEVVCDEMPCLAVLRAHPDSPGNSIRSTEAWRRRFHAVGSGYSGYADCGDGRRERIEIASASWDGQHDPMRMSAGDYMKAQRESSRSGIKEYRMQEIHRLRARWTKIREAWKCLPAGPEK